MLDQNLQAEFIEALLSRDELSHFIHPSERIHIYHNNVEQTLLNSLSHTYPITCNLIGHDCFTAIARSYVQNYPSTSSNLNEYGEFFHTFIANDPRTSHLSYLTDVCYFEWVHHILHDAPHQQPLDVQRLRSLNTHDYDYLQLEMLPASKLFHSHYPLIDIVELGLGQRQEKIQLNTGGIHLLIYRPELTIKTLVLAAEDYAFLEGIAAHSTLKLALDCALKINPQFQLETKLPFFVQQHIIVDFVNLS